MIKNKKTTTLFIIAFLSALLVASNSTRDGEITIFMIGDSTMADKPYEDGNPEKGWGQVFPLYFKDGVSVQNHAVNGRSTKSFIDEGRWKAVLDQLSPGDYVIIEFGHNDQKAHDKTRYAAAETDYRQNLIHFINDTRSKGAMPILATPIVRRRFDESGTFYDTHGTYPEVVRAVAKQEQVSLFDLHQESEALLVVYGEERSKMLFLHIESGEYARLPDGKVDDTHLSAIGAFHICDMVVGEIRKNIPNLTKYLKE